MKSTLPAVLKQFSLVFLALISLTALFAMPSTLAVASPPNQQSNDASGVWDITVIDPGGWEMKGEMRQKDADGTWSDPTPVSVNGPERSETSFVLNLSMKGDQINGTFKLEPQIDCTSYTSEGNLLSSDQAIKLCQMMNSGDAKGNVKGNQVQFTIGEIFSLEGTISGETMQGTGQFDMWKKGKYMEDADIPVTFSASRREGTALVDCQAKLSTPDNLTPGDDLWVSATFTGSDGKEIVPKSHAYYINGKETTSVEWNGEAASIELQYTCPNGEMKTEKLTIPAYVAPKQEEEPKEKPDSKEKAQDEESKPVAPEGSKEEAETNRQEENPGGIDLEQAANIAVIAGGMLTAVSGAVGGGLVIKTLAEAAKAANLAKDATVVTQVAEPPVEIAQIPSEVGQTISRPSEVQRSTPGDERISSAEKARLKTRLRELQKRHAELTHRQDLLRHVQQSIYQSKERQLLRYQKNASRVILRGALAVVEVGQIAINPSQQVVGTIVYYTQEILSRAVQTPPQGATDAQILETQRQNIQRLNNEIQNIKQQRHQAMVDEENGLREMEEIQNRLRNKVELPFE